MAFDDWLAEISLLLNEMQGEDVDAHEIYMKIRQILDTMKAEGLPLPDDLVKLEEELERQFAADAKPGS